MTTYTPGSAATFEAVFAADATAVTVTILDALGTPVLAPTSAGIVHAGTGTYLYTWPIPAEQGTATLTVYWTATVDSAPASFAQVFAVSATGLPGTWCSLADVTTYTGSTDVVQADLNVAQVLLEGTIHRIWRPTDVAKRDIYWLSRATAFQALYVHAHPELLTMMDVQSISQDGLSITFRQGTQTLPIIAPVAKRILDALFRGSNTTVRLNSAFQKNRMVRAGVGSGGSSPWSPM